MIVYPKLYLEKATDITEEMLLENNIKGIILDVDNTLIYYNKDLLAEMLDVWCKNLQQKGIKFCIVSNSNKKEKVKMVADKLDIPYISFGMKPLKRGLNKAKKILGLKNEEIAVVGGAKFLQM